MRRSQYLILRTLFLLGFLCVYAEARTVRSSFDLKFYEIASYDQPAQYLGFTSSKVDNFVSVPLGDNWFVRPDGPMDDERYDALFTELKEHHFPGLDFSDRWDVKNQTITRLSELESLRVLKLNNTKITPSGLVILQKIPKLKILALNNQTTDSGLQHLRNLQKLESLELHGSKITDQGLTVLLHLPQLVRLDLSNTRVTDAGARTLVRLPSLRQLDITGTGITDKGIALLAQLPRLETIYVSAHATGQGLKALATIKKLRNLDVSGSRITDQSLAALTGSKIEALALSGTPIGDAGLVHVATLKTLKTLELSDTRMTPEGLYVLAELPHLETLSVSWNELTDPELQALGNLTHLKRIILNGRTLPPQVLSRIRAMAKLIKPKHEKTVALDHAVVVGMAPASHPVSVPASPHLLQSRSVASPRLRTGGDALRGSTLPPDLLPATPVKNAIVDNEMKGKGMEIEVGVGSGQGSGRGRALTGLKRIYQAELMQNSHDPDMIPGENKQIHFPDESAANSLGEIEVGGKRSKK